MLGVLGQAQPPRCPFADDGVVGASMSTCPGFRPEAVSFATVLGDTRVGTRIASAESCAHLHAAHSGRGWYPACDHPGGLPRMADGSLVRRPARPRHPV